MDALRRNSAAAGEMWTGWRKKQWSGLNESLQSYSWDKTLFLKENGADIVQTFLIKI